MDPLLAGLLGGVVGILLGLAILGGLYLGERGRRIDAQRREGRIPVGRPKKPSVSPPDRESATHDQAVALEEARDRYISETVAEVGCSEEEAAEDWDKMIAAANTEQPSPWPASG